MTTSTNTIANIVSSLKSAQLSWSKITDSITLAVQNGESFDLLAVEIGGKIKASKFEYTRPELACLVDSCVAGGLEKASTKKFISEMIAAAGFEAYSPALFTRHLGRHFAKAVTNDGSNGKTPAKKAVSVVIISLIANLESAEGASACLAALNVKLAELSAK